jgi:NADPH:quinone reductase-like Zn-dependent oxidoreductase
MKAFTQYRYGGPEVLQLEEIPKPTIKKGDLLVRVYANSANPADWHLMRGTPKFARLVFGLLKPKQKVLGADFAGVVEAIGPEVSHFKPGDRVFGESLRGGAFAEYVCISAEACAKTPDHASFTDMACLPIAGLTALQGLITYGQLKPGESVLINGASGGVGHFAVQLAKAYGAKVTAGCSSPKSDFVLSLGADDVICYDKDDIHSHSKQYDLVIDTHGNLSFNDFKRMGKRGVLIGFTTFGNMMGVLLKAAISKFQFKQFTAKANRKDLETLADLFAKHQLKPHVAKTYPNTQIPEALGFIEQMRTTGKVVMVWREEK